MKQNVFPNLAMLMALHDITPENIAGAANVSLEVVQQWLSGKKDIPMEGAISIKKFFPRFNCEEIFEKENVPYTMAIEKRFHETQNRIGNHAVFLKRDSINAPALEKQYKSLDYVNHLAASFGTDEQGNPYVQGYAVFYADGRTSELMDAEQWVLVSCDAM